MGEQGVSAPSASLRHTLIGALKENLAGPHVLGRKGQRVLPAHPHAHQSHADDRPVSGLPLLPTGSPSPGCLASQRCPFSRSRLYKGEEATRPTDLQPDLPLGPAVHWLTCPLPWRHRRGAGGGCRREGSL